MTNTYIPQDAWSAQGNSPAETGALRGPNPVLAEQVVQWQRAVMTHIMAAESLQAVAGQAAGQILQQSQDEFPQQPDQQVPWMAQSMSGEVPLERMQQRIAGAPEPQKTALMKHVQRIQTGRRIWDWFYQRGQERGQLDSNVFGMGWAENVGAPATFQSSGVDALYGEVKDFAETGLVSTKPPGFEHSLMDKASRLGLTGIMGALAPDPDKSPLVLPSEAGHEMSQSHLGRIAMEAAKAGYGDATSQMSFGAKGVQKLEQMAGFLLPGGPMIGAGKSLAIRGAETLMGRSLGAVGRVLAGGAGVAGALGSYEAAKGLPSHYQEMVDRIAEQKGPEAAEEAKGKLWALHLGMQIPAAILMETMGAAAKPLESAIAGPVTKGINVLDEGGERIAQAGIGNFAREKAAQAVGGVAQGVGLSVGSQVSEDTVTRDAVKQITGENPGLRTSLMRAWASVFLNWYKPEEREKLFWEAGKDLMAEGAAFGAYSALQAIRPRIESAGPVESFRRLEEAITPAARAAARHDPILSPEANRLFPSSPEVAPVDMEVKNPPAVIPQADPALRGVPSVSPSPATPDVKADVERPVSEKPAAEGGPSEGPKLPGAAAPPEEPASVQPPEEPKLPTPLSDRERVSVAGQLQPGTTFRMKDVFGGRELTVVGGKLQIDKKGRWGGGIRVKDGDREITIIPEMLDQVDAGSIARGPRQADAGAVVPRDDAGVLPDRTGAVGPSGQVDLGAPPKPKRVRGRVEQLEHPFDIVTGKGERVPVEIERSKTDPSQFIAKVEEPGQGPAYFGGTLTEIHDKIEKGLKEKGWKSVEATSPFGKAAIDLKREASEYEAQVKALSIEQGKAEMRRVQKRKEEAQRLIEDRGRKMAEELARKGGFTAAPEGDISASVSRLVGDIETTRRAISLEGATPELQSQLSTHLAEFRGLPEAAWKKARETPEGRTLVELLRQTARGIPMQGGRHYTPPELLGGEYDPLRGQRGMALFNVRPGLEKALGFMRRLLWGEPEMRKSTALSRSVDTHTAWTLRSDNPFDYLMKRPKLSRWARLKFLSTSLNIGEDLAEVIDNAYWDSRVAAQSVFDKLVKARDGLRGIRMGSEESQALFMSLDGALPEEDRAEARASLVDLMGEERAAEATKALTHAYDVMRRYYASRGPTGSAMRAKIQRLEDALAKAEKPQRKEDLAAKLAETKAGYQDHKDTWGKTLGDYITHIHADATKSNWPWFQRAWEQQWRRESIVARYAKKRQDKPGYVMDAMAVVGPYFEHMIRSVVNAEAMRKAEAMIHGRRMSIGNAWPDQNGTKHDPLDYLQKGNREVWWGTDSVRIAGFDPTTGEVSIIPVGGRPSGHFEETLPEARARRELVVEKSGLMQYARSANAEQMLQAAYDAAKNSLLFRRGKGEDAPETIDNVASKVTRIINGFFYRTLIASSPKAWLNDGFAQLAALLSHAGPRDAVRGMSRAFQIATGQGDKLKALVRRVVPLRHLTNLEWTGRSVTVDLKNIATPKGLLEAMDRMLSSGWHAAQKVMGMASILSVDPEKLATKQGIREARDRYERVTGNFPPPMQPDWVRSYLGKFISSIGNWPFRYASIMWKDISEARNLDRAQGGPFNPQNWTRPMRKMVLLSSLSFMAEHFAGQNMADMFGIGVLHVPGIRKAVLDLKEASGIDASGLFIPFVPFAGYVVGPIVEAAEAGAQALMGGPMTQQQWLWFQENLSSMVWNSSIQALREAISADVTPDGKYTIRFPATPGEAWWPAGKLTGEGKMTVKDPWVYFLRRLAPGSIGELALARAAHMEAQREGTRRKAYNQELADRIYKAGQMPAGPERKAEEASIDKLIQEKGSPDPQAIRRAIKERVMERDLGVIEKRLFQGESTQRASYLLSYLATTNPNRDLVARAARGINFRLLDPQIRERLIGRLAKFQKEDK